MEIEQWEIFVEWNKKYELGQVDASTHPGHGGIDKRWDEIEDILKPIRESIPSNTFESKAKFEQIDQKIDMNQQALIMVWFGKPNKYSQQGKNSVALHFCLCCKR